MKLCIILLTYQALTNSSAQYNYPLIQPAIPVIPWTHHQPTYDSEDYRPRHIEYRRRYDSSEYTDTQESCYCSCKSCSREQNNCCESYCKRCHQNGIVYPAPMIIQQPLPQYIPVVYPVVNPAIKTCDTTSATTITETEPKKTTETKITTTEPTTKTTTTRKKTSESKIPTNPTKTMSTAYYKDYRRTIQLPMNAIARINFKDLEPDQQEYMYFYPLSQEIRFKHDRDVYELPVTKYRKHVLRSGYETTMSTVGYFVDSVYSEEKQQVMKEQVKKQHVKKEQVKKEQIKKQSVKKQQVMKDISFVTKREVFRKQSYFLPGYRPTVQNFRGVKDRIYRQNRIYKKSRFHEYPELKAVGASVLTIPVRFRTQPPTIKVFRRQE